MDSVDLVTPVFNTSLIFCALLAEARAFVDLVTFTNYSVLIQILMDINKKLGLP
jgi:hypothetical protein